MRVSNDHPLERQTGRTTQQLQRAPERAVFIWCNQYVNYPKELAKKLGRDDIEIHSPSILEQDGYRLRGKKISALILDHACVASPEEYDVIDQLSVRVIQQL